MAGQYPIDRRQARRGGSPFRLGEQFTPDRLRSELTKCALLLEPPPKRENPFFYGLWRTIVRRKDCVGNVAPIDFPQW